MKVYSLIPVIALFIGFMLIETRERGIIKKWFIGSRPFIAIHYLFPAVLGIFLGTHLFQKPVPYLDVFFLMCAIFFSFQTSVVTNDANDLRTDQISEKKSLLNRSSHKITHISELGMYFFIVSILFALAIRYRILLIVVLGHILHFIYSSKPLRLKRFYPLSILMLTLGALLAAIAGYALFESSKPFLSFPLKATLLITVPLFLGLNFRDLADYQGDRKTEIATLFTVFGLQKGRYINAIFILLSYLSIPFILNYPLFFIATVPLGVLSFYFCLKQPFQEKYVFYIYFTLVAILTIAFNIDPTIITL
jgi:4-hydroxybenzoate polyprenyltransferase